MNKVEIDKVLLELVAGPEPDLIIMDHRLDMAYSNTYRTGSTAAIFIHEYWASCPIISLTGVELEEIDIRHRSLYEGMYPITRISDYYSSIMSIAEGFSTLKRKIPKDIDTLISLFIPSEEDANKIKKVLPKELKQNFEDKSLLLEIFRWYRSIIYKRPGFLYSEIWAATLLGLNIEGFRKVKGSFDSTKYSGIFVDEFNPRWWKSGLLQKLCEIVEKTGTPWVIGQELVKRDSKLLSKCFASGEEHPETVAAEDTTIGAKWYPMKLKYTEPNPNYEDMLFFEELRLMKPAK